MRVGSSCRVALLPARAGRRVRGGVSLPPAAAGVAPRVGGALRGKGGLPQPARMCPGRGNGSCATPPRPLRATLTCRLP